MKRASWALLLLLFFGFFLLFGVSSPAYAGQTCTNEATGHYQAPFPPFIIDNYEQAEYQNGLLVIHFHLLKDNTTISDQVQLFDGDCNGNNPIPGSAWGAFGLNPEAAITIPASTTNISVRYASTTHYDYWDDDTNTKLPCPTCGRDIPATAVNGSVAHILNTAFFNDLNTHAYTILENPPPCSLDCNSSVLFLPGIEGSSLYQSPDTKRWAPTILSDVGTLSLDTSGHSLNDIFTKPNDVVDQVSVFKYYRSFFDSLDTLKQNGLINDWEAVPYDWRLSVDQIVNAGAYSNAQIRYDGPQSATSTPYIIQELRNLAATSKSGKVTIVTHSNGGLVAKALLIKLQQTNDPLLQQIDKVIMVAAPQIGTPQAIASLLNGNKTGLPLDNFPVLVTPQSARVLGANMSGAYGLLPSAQYFTYVDDPVITFDTTTLPSWASRYGNTIHSQVTLHNFLVDTQDKVSSSSPDLNTPDSLNATLLTQEENLHQTLDAWEPPSNIKVIQIAGWGVDSTVSGITYSQGNRVDCPLVSPPCITTFGIKYSPQFTIDGDGTVVTPSALWLNATNTQRYWLDLGTYNSLLSKAERGTIASTKHSDLFEVKSLINFVDDLTVNNLKSNYSLISGVVPASNAIRLHYSLHSPLTLDAYDDLGDHTGISTTTGLIEEGIPGSYFAVFGDQKYLFTDASSTVHIIMNGFATSTFTFNVDELQGDTEIASTTFKDIPTTPTTKVKIDTQSDINTLSSMQIDKNGDGVTDSVLPPKPNGVVTFDTTPPEFTITFSTSTNALTFFATDDSGAATISSTTTFPVLKKNQKDPKGIATTTVTAIDTSGNTMALVYTENLPSPLKRDTISLVSLSYNGATVSLSNTGVSYKWRTAKDNSYSLFASFLSNASTSTESHYRPKKGLTVIMSKPVDLDDSDDDTVVDARPTKEKKPGLIIPQLITDRGKVKIVY